MSFLLRVPLISLRAFVVAFEKRNFKKRQRGTPKETASVHGIAIYKRNTG